MEMAAGNKHTLFTGNDMTHEHILVPVRYKVGHLNAPHLGAHVEFRQPRLYFSLHMPRLASWSLRSFTCKSYAAIKI